MNNNEKKLYNQLVVVGEPKVSFININDVVLVKEDTFKGKERKLEVKRWLIFLKNL